MTYDLTEIDKAAQQILKNTSSKVVCFYGEMGAGKTTLIKTMVQQLGGATTGNSPTFGIVNEYHTKEDVLLAFHFDFYRLNDESEVLDLGFEDYLNQNAWVFIEWPEKIPSFIPEDATSISIDIISPSVREISF